LSHRVEHLGELHLHHLSVPSHPLR
jgi:hypothetical protein